MARNLEIKIRIENPDKMIERALALGAKPFARLNQKDVYFNSDKGLLKLRIMPEHSEFILYNRNEKEGDRWSDYFVLNINNTENPEEFFKRIFETDVVVEKEREVLMYRNTRIHIDKVKELGNFLELETMVTSDLEDARERFNFLVETLELDLSKQIKKSYRDLISENASSK